MYYTENIPLQTRKKLPKRTRMEMAIKHLPIIQAERCRRSFYYFLKLFWPEISTDEYKDNWHIRYLCQELQKVAERVANKLPADYDLLINIPPGTTKSIVCTIAFPAWCWIRWYWMRFIAASYSGALSLEHAEKCRDLVKSDRYRSLFPQVKIRSDKDTKSSFTVCHMGELPSRGGARYSTSVGGTVTGMHGHILLVDDPLNPYQAASDKEIETANRWMSETLSTRKTDKAVTTTILVMQRLRKDDPAGHWLKNKVTRIRHICLPGEIRSEGAAEVSPPELLQYYRDGLLDPVRMPWDVLQKTREDLGQYGYMSQILQNPQIAGSGMFDISKIHVVEHIEPVNILRIVRYWDKAGTEGGGTYTVGIKMAELSHNRYYVMDVVRGQWAPAKRERIIRETAINDGPEVVCIIEQEPGSGGKESAQNTAKGLSDVTSVVFDRPTGDKVYRADPLSVAVGSGILYIKKAAWNNDLLAEMADFPHSKFKDQVDAMSGAFNYFRAKSKMIGAF